MNEFLKAFYNIEVIAIINISNTTYRIKAKDGNYYLKYVSNPNLDNIIIKLEMMRIDTFSYIIKNVYGNYVSSYNGINFIVSEYMEDDYIDAKDIKMKMYINKIAELHNKSFYTLSVSKDFFLETYDYIENKLIDVNNYLEDIIASIEKKDYKSPFEWMYIMNYNYLKKCMDKSYEYLEKFKRSSEEKTSIRMVLAYLNFDYNHIMLKEGKIISIENMVNAPPIYDIVDVVNNGFNTYFDMSSFINSYLKMFPLQEYEKYWLLSLLYIPKIDLSTYNEFDKMGELINSLEYCNTIDKIEKIIESE